MLNRIWLSDRYLKRNSVFQWTIDRFENNADYLESWIQFGAAKYLQH